LVRSYRVDAGIFRGHGGKPDVAHPLALPPEVAGISRSCKSIAIEDRPDIARRFIGEGIAGEKTDRTRVVVKELGDECQRPGILLG